MKALNEIREEINSIDSQILALFEKRMDCAAGVIKYKLAHGLPIFDALREREILAKCSEAISNKAYSEYYTEFMRGLMNLSKAYQRKLAKQNAIGYQGTKGAFSHIAATTLFPVGDLHDYTSFEAVFAALDAGDIAFGVLPFENSYAGEVAEVLDLLLAHDCHIVQMYKQKVVHNLVGLQGATIKDITDVYSHQQAIWQCQDFLKSHGLVAQPYPNTALAAEYVSLEQCPHKAAIASRETATLYNLEILAENINTSMKNSTKFIVIAKDEAKNGDRLSLIFTVKHDTGQLAKIMAIIAKHNFNMENIRSRPLRTVQSQQWQYYFYVEIHGSLQTAATQDLMAELRDACEWIKILGNYTLQE